jgi:hypothetical protein
MTATVTATVTDNLFKHEALPFPFVSGLLVYDYADLFRAPLPEVLPMTLQQ